jgi:hypothetical protein
MITTVIAWRTDPGVRFEWKCLHARHPIPLGVLPVWGGLFLFTIALIFPWAHAPLISTTVGDHSWSADLLRKCSAPSFLIHTLLFWLLPWMMLERRMLYRGRTLDHLQKKTAVLIRLYLCALLAFPLIRLGSFGLYHIAHHGDPAPTLIDTILYDSSRPMAQRYFFTLFIALCFGMYTLSMVVLRLRLAQWAAVSTDRRFDRFVGYAIPSIVFAVFLLALKRNVYNLLNPYAVPEEGMPALMLKRNIYSVLNDSYAVPEGGMSAQFLQHWLPWVLISIALCLLAAHLAHVAARVRERVLRPTPDLTPTARGL